MQIPLKNYTLIYFKIVSSFFLILKIELLRKKKFNKLKAPLSHLLPMFSGIYKVYNDMQILYHFFMSSNFQNVIFFTL